MRVSVILAAGAVALALPMAGCGQGNAKGGGDTAGNAAAPSAMRSGPRAGLWRLTSTPGVEGVPPMVQEVCVTNETFEAPDPNQSAGASGMTCTPPSGFTRDGDAMVATTSCTAPGGRSMDSTVRVTGDFDSQYTMVASIRMTPAVAGMGEMTMTTQGERLGDCPA